MNEDVLEHIHDALQELENVYLEDIPLHLQDDFTQAHSLLMHLSVALDV